MERQPCERAPERHPGSSRWPRLWKGSTAPLCSAGTAAERRKCERGMGILMVGWLGEGEALGCRKGSSSSWTRVLLLFIFKPDLFSLGFCRLAPCWHQEVNFQSERRSQVKVEVFLCLCFSFNLRVRGGGGGPAYLHVGLNHPHAGMSLLMYRVH